MNSIVFWYNVKYGMLIFIFGFLCYISYKFIKGYIKSRKQEQYSPDAEKTIMEATK